MTGLLALAGIVGLIWGLILFRHTGFLGGALAVLLAGTCFGHAFFHANLGPVPLTTDRVLLGLLLAVYAIERIRGSAARRVWDRQDLVLVAFVLTLTVSTFTHDWQAHGYRSLASLLFFYLMPLGIYWLGGYSPVATSPDRPVRLLGHVRTVLVLTSVLEAGRMWSLVFPRYIVSETFPEFLGRGRGPLLNPVGNGLFLCVGWFSLCMFWPRVGRHGKAVIAALSVVYVAGLFGTLTRGVWLAAGLGFPLLVAVNLPRRQAAVLLMFLALVGGGTLAARRHQLAAFKRDIHVSVQDMSRSAGLRPLLTHVAWRMFEDRPLTGCGYRQYETAHTEYLSDRSTPLVLEQARGYVQHNVFLALLAETGLIGFGLFALLPAVWARTAWRLWRGEAAPETRQFGLLMLAFLAAFLALAMFHDLTLIPMVNMLVFFLAGIQRSLAAPPLGATQNCPARDREDRRARTAFGYGVPCA